MLQNAILIINTIGLILIEVLLGPGINITQNLPTGISPGDEVKVTVTVNKGDIIGFAKLQLELGEGFTATAIETKGASFTFADQKAKFIWMSLPNQESFEVSYNLRVDAGASGEVPVSGRFSYIENNERRTHEIPPTYVSISAAVANNTTSDPATTGSNATNSVDPSNTSTTATGTTTTSTTAPMTNATNATNDVADAANVATTTATNATTTTANNVDKTVTNATTTAGNATGTVKDATTTAGNNVATTSNAISSSNPASTTTSTMTNTASSQGPGGISGVRTVTELAGSEMLVSVKIAKGNLRGFGKLQETIPTGFDAIERDNGDAIFTSQDNIVKFVWLNLPSQSDMVVAYVLRPKAGTPAASYEVNGEFGYLLNDETQKAVLGSTSFTLKAMDALAQNTNTTTTTNNSNSTGTSNNGSTTTQKSNTNTTAANSQQVKIEDKVSRIPSPEAGVNYKVQITAAHKEVGKPYFAERHKYNEDFSIERHEGWIKYVTGKYDAYRQARDRREVLVSAGHKFPGPFVTAYNDGQRITVQEALMISNQKWVQ